MIEVKRRSGKNPQEAWSLLERRAAIGRPSGLIRRRFGPRQVAAGRIIHQLELQQADAHLDSQVCGRALLSEAGSAFLRRCGERADPNRLLSPVLIQEEAEQNGRGGLLSRRWLRSPARWFERRIKAPPRCQTVLQRLHLQLHFKAETRSRNPS